MSKRTTFIAFLLALGMLLGTIPTWTPEISAAAQHSMLLGMDEPHVLATEAAEVPVVELSFWDNVLSVLFIVFVVVCLCIPAVLILVLGPLYIVLGLVSLLVPSLKPWLPPIALIIRRSFRVLLFFVTLSISDSDSDSDGGGGGSFGGGGSGRSW